MLGGGVNGNNVKLHCFTFLNDNLSYLVFHFESSELWILRNVFMLNVCLTLYTLNISFKLLFHVSKALSLSLFIGLTRTYIVHL